LVQLPRTFLTFYKFTTPCINSTDFTLMRD